MLLLIALCGACLLLKRVNAPAEQLTLWTFSAESANAADRLLNTPGMHSVTIERLSDRAENLRLQSMLLANGSSTPLPNVVELEINQVGRFLRPSVDQIGFLDLSGYLKVENAEHLFLPGRLASYTKAGRVFGLPMDAHPVALAYRDDLFRAAGIDLSQNNSWPSFAEDCRRFQIYWKAHGGVSRHAMELSSTRADSFIIMLMQRRIELIDSEGNVRLDDAKLLDTLLQYASMAVDIGTDSAGEIGWQQDVAQGNFCVTFMPDWRVARLRAATPELAGKFRLMPLPRFTPEDAQTASWGGTMLAIPRNARQPDQSWNIIRQLLFSNDAAEQAAKAGVLPAVVDQWKTSAWQEPDEYFGGQPIGALYIQLASQLPASSVSPQTLLARAELSVVLAATTHALRQSGPAAARTTAQRWLAWAAADMRARVTHDRLVS